MNISTFIKRPVLSTVISIFIVLSVCWALLRPCRAIPQHCPADHQRVDHLHRSQRAERAQLSYRTSEEQINGAENMDYMYSSAANNGSAQIQIYFKPGTDPNMAAVDVQNRVTKAASFPPRGSESGRCHHKQTSEFAADGVQRIRGFRPILWRNS